MGGASGGGRAAVLCNTCMVTNKLNKVYSNLALFNGIVSFLMLTGLVLILKRSSYYFLLA